MVWAVFNLVRIRLVSLNRLLGAEAVSRTTLIVLGVIRVTLRVVCFVRVVRESRELLEVVRRCL